MVFSVFLTTGNVFATGLSGDDSAVGIEEAIKLKMDITHQNYPEKEITVTLIINSSVDSSKVGVDWFYDDKILKIVGDQKDILNIKAGVPYTIEKKFEPKTNYTLSKNYEMTLATQVVAAAYERNYVNNIEIPIVLNKEFEVTPTLDSFASSKNTYNLLSVGIYIVLGAMVLALVVLAIRRFLDYLEKD